MSAPTLPKAEVAGEGLGRDEWLKVRDTGIGGSDIAAILEVEGAFGSPFTVWLDKTGQKTDFTTTEAMEAGNFYEQRAAERFTEKTGIATVQPEPITIYRSTELPIALASPDRLSADSSAWVEIKWVGSHRLSSWQDGPPEHYEAQCQWQLAVSGLDVCYLAAEIGGQHFVTYEIAADKRYQDEMFERASKFWALVLANKAPEVDGTEATKKAIGATFSEVDPEPYDGGDELALAVAQLVTCQREEKLSKAAVTLAENTVKLLLREHETGVVDGHTVVTWKSEHRSGFTVQPTTFRKLLVPKNARS